MRVLYQDNLQAGLHFATQTDKRQTIPPASKSPVLFEHQHGSFYVPFELRRKKNGDKANSLTSPPNGAIIYGGVGQFTLHLLSIIILLIELFRLVF